MTIFVSLVIAGLVISLVIGVVALTFGVLGWKEGHSHGHEGISGPGLVGVTDIVQNRQLGQHLAFYDTSTGARASSFLQPKRLINRGTETTWGRGKTDTEIVSLWWYAPIHKWYIETMDLNKLNEHPVFLPVVTDSIPIVESTANSNAICWDEKRGRWLACMYAEEAKEEVWELIAFSEDGNGSLVISTAIGSGATKDDFGGPHGGCRGMAFCGERLFAVFSREDYGSEPGIARLVEFEPQTGLILGWHQWNTNTTLEPGIVGSGQVIAEESLHPFLMDKTLLDTFEGIAYDPDQERVYFLMGKGLRTLGWVDLANIPYFLSQETPFDIHVCRDLPTEFLNSIVWVPGKLTLPSEYPVAGTLRSK